MPHPLKLSSAGWTGLWAIDLVEDVPPPGRGVGLDDLLGSLQARLFHLISALLHWFTTYLWCLLLHFSSGFHTHSSFCFCCLSALLCLPLKHPPTEPSVCSGLVGDVAARGRWLKLDLRSLPAQSRVWFLIQHWPVPPSPFSDCWSNGCYFTNGTKAASWVFLWWHIEPHGPLLEGKWCNFSLIK